MEEEWMRTLEIAVEKTRTDSQAFSDDEVMEMADALLRANKAQQKRGDSSALALFARLPTRLRTRMVDMLSPLLRETQGWIQELAHRKRAQDHYRQGQQSNGGV